MSEGAGGVTPGGGCDRKCFHRPTLNGGQILTQPPAAGVRAEKQLGQTFKVLAGYEGLNHWDPLAGQRGHPHSCAA